MSERIVTDSRGQRRDVHEDERGLVFRHQSGRELRADGNWPPLDELSTDELLDTLDAARRLHGLPPVGHGGLDVAFDQEGYETGR